jgi:NDP-sugar pyrophosphorylase family protein
MIPALVLTAGLATRLYPLSLVRAKAALPVAGEPLIQHILRWLAKGGITDAVLNLHHLPHTITGIVGDGMEGVRVRYSWEVPLLGSAGGPRRALPLLDSPTFLIVNGDTLTDVDLGALLAAHRQTDALVTMAVVPNVESAKYSGLAVDNDGAVIGVVARGSAQPSAHFVGVQVVETSAFESLVENVPFESVSGLYPSLIAARPGSVRAAGTTGTFADIGSPRDYLATSLAIARGDSRRLCAGVDTHINPSATLDETIVWDDVEIGAGARLRHCVVTDGVRIPDGTRWENSTIRVAPDTLSTGERRIGDLAVGSL